MDTNVLDAIIWFCSVSICARVGCKIWVNTTMIIICLVIVFVVFVA